MFSNATSRVLVSAALVAVALGGCTAEGPGDMAEISKDEARRSAGKSDHGIDFCDVFDWYGDGECDEFCPEPDPDCRPTAECKSDDDCPTIYCITTPCPSNVCDAGECVIDDPADECPRGQRACQTCGDNFTCAPHEISCPLVLCPPPGGGDDGVACGGWLGDTCADDEYCNYAAGDYCGAADASGVCAAIGGPICPAVIEPVCGCDRVTYQNSCQAAQAGQGIYNNGACERPPVEPSNACETVRCGYGTRCAVCDDGAPGCFLPGEECPDDTVASCAAVFCGYGTRCEICDGEAGCFLPGDGCE